MMSPKRTLRTGKYRLVQRVKATPELELMGTGELSAVCFRHRGLSSAQQQLDEFNTKLLKRILRRGRVYLSNATINGRFCLRACVVNHRTMPEDIDAIISETLETATEV